MSKENNSAQNAQQAIRSMVSILMAERIRPSASTTRALGIKAIESVLSPGKQNIGIKLFAAQEFALNAFRNPELAKIDPELMGVSALVSVLPGMSQQDVADLLGLERAPVGLHVRRCVEEGLIRREASTDDARKYQLYLTDKGAEYLKQVSVLIAAHEERCFGMLSTEERQTLYQILDKMVQAQSNIASLLTPHNFAAK